MVLPDETPRGGSVQDHRPENREPAGRTGEALEHYADFRFRLKHNVPIFGKTFEEVALKYSDELKTEIELGRITAAYWKVVDAYIRNHLIEYCGKIQIAQMGEEKWKECPLWRKRTGKGARGEPVQDGTIRHELITFRAILRYAADKRLLPHTSVPKGKVLHSKARREAFSPQEYRHLHTYARKWVNEAQNHEKKWYRTIVYNFILIMANTGMRTIEARNLRWRTWTCASTNTGADSAVSTCAARTSTANSSPRRVSQRTSSVSRKSATRPAPMLRCSQRSRGSRPAHSSQSESATS